MHINTVTFWTQFQTREAANAFAQNYPDFGMSVSDSEYGRVQLVNPDDLTKTLFMEAVRASGGQIVMDADVTRQPLSEIKEEARNALVFAANQTYEEAMCAIAI